jgi:hypothetical protein
MIFLGAHEIVANNNEDLSWSPCHHSRSRGMSDSASKTAKDEISAEAQRRADDAALKVNEDAKPFAANLRSEILTRVHRESTTLDSLFDADALR